MKPDAAKQGPKDDLIQRFKLESLGVRGRIVRLGAVADSVIGAHAYPDPVAGILGETLALTAGLAGALSFDGIFTVQTKGDGPISMLVADTTSDGEMRGYAEFDEKQLEEVTAAGREAVAGGERVSAARLLGAGHLAFTVDQGVEQDRHQAIVELAGPTLADCAHEYFRRAERIEAHIRLAAGRVTNGAQGWRAGAIILERLPEEEDDLAAFDDEAVEDWRRAMVLMGSVTDAELIDPKLSPEDLLVRLFHEERVRVFRPKPLIHHCRCNAERVERILAAIPRDELDEMKVDGEVVVTCQFCNARYVFDEPALERLYEEADGLTS